MYIPRSFVKVQYIVYNLFLKTQHGEAFFPFVNGLCHFQRSMLGLVIEPLITINVVYRKKANNTFLNSLRKKDVESQVECTLKVMERARVTCY